MTLTDLAALGSFISGLGVIVSLVYLALQIRQNALTHRAAGSESWLRYVREENRAAAEPEMITLVQRVEAGDDGLSDAELTRYMMHELNWLMGVDHLFWLHKNKILDDDQFNGAMLVLRDKMNSPATRATWQLAQHTASPALRSAVEAQLARPVRGPLGVQGEMMSLVGVWRTAWKAARQSGAAASSTSNTEQPAVAPGGGAP